MAMQWLFMQYSREKRSDNYEQTVSLVPPDGLFPRIAHSHLPADRIHGPAEAQAVSVGMQWAFQYSLIQAGRHFPDLVLKSIDHRLYGKSLCFLTGAKKGQFVVLIPGSGQLDHAGRACDLCCYRGLTGQGRADHRGSSIPVMQDGLAGLIGSCGRQMGRCTDRIGFPQQQQAKEEGIDADIQERASSQPEVIQSAFGLEGARQTQTD